MWAIAGTIGIILTSTRAFEIGWSPRDYIQFSVVSAVVVAAVFRRQIVKQYKAALLIVANLIIGILGIYTLGMLAGGVFFFPLAAVIIALIYSARTVTFFVVVFTTLLIFIAGSFITGNLQLNISADTLHESSRHWFVFIYCIIFFFIITCATILSYRRYIHQLLSEISSQRDELLLLKGLDDLTGLPRSRIAQDALMSAINRAQRSNHKVALFFIDIDDFKKVNDSQGHEAGDYCIKTIVERMTGLLRPYDVLARVGGDEFLLILDDINHKNDAASLAQKLIEQAANPIVYKQNEFAVGLSIGIALYPDQTEDIAELKEFADKAMYRAKQEGKNQFSFYN